MRVCICINYMFTDGIFFLFVKYGLLAPFVAHSIYSFATQEVGERNYFNFLIFPFILLRMLHSQLWISYSRYRTAKNRIVDKSIEFDQVDRERDW